MPKLAPSSGSVVRRPRWPLIVMRTPKGWTGHASDRRSGHRRHVSRTPGASFRKCGTTSSTWPRSKRWLRSYRPEDLFDEQGKLLPAWAAQAPSGDRAYGRQPACERGGRLTVPLSLPDIAQATRCRCPKPGAELHESTRQLGLVLILRDVYRDNPRNSPGSLCPDETNFEPARRGLRGRAALPGGATR